MRLGSHLGVSKKEHVQSVNSSLWTSYCSARRNPFSIEVGRLMKNEHVKS